MSTSASLLLSPSQLATLAAIGEERSASVGELLYRVGDRIYPFIAILEGEVAIVDAAGNELIRQGPSGFLGELNLLSGQTVFVSALVAEPLRYIAVARSALRSLLNEDGPLSDLLLSTFISRREALQSVQGIGLEIVGPHDSEPTMRMLEFARANRLPYIWEDAALPGGGALPFVRLPGGGELHGPTSGQVLRALGIGLELAPREEVDLLIVGAGPAGLAAAVYGASEGLETLVIESTALGGQAGSSRRIENYLGFPAGISGTELTSRAVTQARKFNARTATPYRALSLEPGDGRHLVRLEEDREIATLHGEDGHLAAVTLTSGERVPFSFMFLFLGALPCTEWLGDVVARDPKGFVLTGPEAGAEGLLETSVPGVYAAGDVRAGSIKRCATAVGEGATVVRFVHERLS